MQKRRICASQQARGGARNRAARYRLPVIACARVTNTHHTHMLACWQLRARAAASLRKLCVGRTPVRSQCHAHNVRSQLQRAAYARKYYMNDA